MTIESFVILSGLLFSIGLLGLIMNRSNLISVLLSIELMLLASLLNFGALSSSHNHHEGALIALFIMAVAACEVAVGLAILVTLFNKKNTIYFKNLTLLGEESARSESLKDPS